MDTDSTDTISLLEEAQSISETGLATASGEVALPEQDMARVRHELRTPLNQIIGYTELLIEEVTDIGEAGLLPDLHRVRNASNTLLALVSEHFGKAVVTDRQLTQPPALAALPYAAAAVQEDAATAGQSKLLIVDDLEANRDMLARRLQRQGHRVATAANGREALERLRTEPFDLLLLDVVMPELDGYETLRQIKADPVLLHIPVIMISALGELDSVIRCIELGAEDYLPKPFNPILLRARIGACLEKKRLRDQEQEHLRQIAREQAKAEQLLHNVFPADIARRLEEGENFIAERFDEVTILFADLAGFTPFAAGQSPDELVAHLNAIFREFDHLTEAHGAEKIKTIGDAYMAAVGVPRPRPDHEETAAKLALAMQAAMKELRQERGLPLEIRIGLHTGPVVAGVIGPRRFAYDLWGDTVNLAHRMQSHGEPGRIHASAQLQQKLAGRFRFESAGTREIKGWGPMNTAFLLGQEKP